MAISLRAAGTPTAAAVSVSAVAPAVPTGATTGDLSVLTVWMKPYNTTITTPSGWTKIGEHTNGTTASGTDVGSMKVAVFVQESAAVGAIPALTMTGANSVGAVINTYAKASNEGWDYSAFTQGFDAVNDANYSATGAAGISVAAGDWVVASTAVCGDIGTVSAQAIAGMSGATLGTIANRTNSATTTGNDSRGLVSDIPVTAGSSSAAPTFTYTNASSTSGTTMWLRLRVVPLTSVSKTLATSWNASQSVAKATATTWHVRSEVTAARSTLWNVLAVVSPKTLAALWNVNAQVAAARSTLWNVASSVSKALDTSWNVLSAGLTSVSRALSTSWHVISQVAKATSTSWHVRMQVAASRSTSWHVLSRVAAATRSTLWNVAGRVTAARSTTWNVAAIVSASRSTTWNVRTIVAATRSTLWNVRAFVSASRSTLWNVMLPDLQAVSRALSVTWNTFARLGRTFSTYWGVTTPTVTLTVNNAAHTSASSQPSLTITHVIAQVNGASHGLRSGEPTLVQNSTLLVHDASHWLESDRVHLKQWKQAYLFRTPKAGAIAFHTDRLVVRLGLPAGVTLLVNGGIVVESQYPTEEQLAAADAAYVGGHEYVITPSAAAILTTAGYGSFLSPTEVLQEV